MKIYSGAMSLVAVILAFGTFCIDSAYADRVRFQPGQGVEVPYRWPVEEITVSEGDTLSLILERKNTDFSSAWVEVAPSLALFIRPDEQVAIHLHDYEMLSDWRVDFPANGVIEQTIDVHIYNDSQVEGVEYGELVIMEAIGTLATQPYRRISIKILDNVEDPSPFQEADFNLDGCVNALDLNVLAIHWTGAGDHSEGDATGDGLVNASDLNVLALQWLSGPECP